MDGLWERCTWDFEFIVPNALETASDDDQGDIGNETVPIMVVCSGELIEKVAHPHDSKKSIFVYSQTVPTSVQHIAFAIGPFHLHSIPLESSTMDPSMNGSTPGPGGLSLSRVSIHTFCLPGLEASLRASTSFYRQAMSFFTTEYGSYPFGSFKVVFVDELPAERFDGSAIVLATNDLLHDDMAIDQVFDTRQALAHALACQWVGVNIIPKSWSDLWLVNGLGFYITSLFIRRHFGNNEYRFRLRKDMDRVVSMDTGNMPPLCAQASSEPPDPTVLAFINVKAPIVLYILDRRLGKSGTALGLSRVLPKVFLTAISGEMANNAVSTHSFLRTCRKVSGVDIRSFSDQWIFGSGCPNFKFRATFNKKKMAVELNMAQHTPAYLYNDHDPARMLLYNPVQAFEVWLLFYN